VTALIIGAVLAAALIAWGVAAYARDTIEERRERAEQDHRAQQICARQRFAPHTHHEEYGGTHAQAQPAAAAPLQRRQLTQTSPARPSTASLRAGPGTPSGHLPAPTDLVPGAGDPTSPVTTATCPGAEVTLKVDSPAPGNVPGRDGKRPGTPATATAAATPRPHTQTQQRAPGHPAGDLMAATLHRASQIAAVRQQPLWEYMATVPAYEHDTGWFSAIGGAS